MKTLLDSYNFAENWAEINPRFAFGDKEVNLNIQFFTDLDVARCAVIGSDCTHIQIQDFMVRVTVALSYCNVMTARLGGILVQTQENLEKQKAIKAGALVGSVKSDAALERQLSIDSDLITLKWEVEDLKIMKDYTENIFKVLTKDAENWRARFYGAQQDRKLTPNVEAPYTGGNDDGAVPPPIGG